jgi:hypothetical protein
MKDDPLRVLDDKAVLLWHWICLGAGIAVLAGCIAFLVRERS